MTLNQQSELMGLLNLAVETTLKFYWESNPDAYASDSEIYGIWLNTSAFAIGFLTEDPEWNKISSTFGEYVSLIYRVNQASEKDPSDASLINAFTAEELEKLNISIIREDRNV